MFVVLPLAVRTRGELCNVPYSYVILPGIVKTREGCFRCLKIREEKYIHSTSTNSTGYIFSSVLLVTRNEHAA